MQRPLIIKDLELDSPLFLAPMAGYSDLPFRMAVRGLGGLGLAYTEMLNPRSILYGGGRKRATLLATEAGDTPLAHQIYGHDPELMAAGAQWLQEHGARLIDINMGCPQKKIAGTGAGAGLLRDCRKAIQVAVRVAAAVKLPVTVKLRLGWDARSHVAVALASELEQAGMAAITVHGRTCGQRYAGQANWDEIGRVVRAVQRIPVIGNGDVVSPEAARSLADQTGCAGIMLGRGVLSHPWLIREIWHALYGTAPAPTVTREERRRFMVAHFDRHVAHYGEPGGVVLFRKWIPLYAKGLGLQRARMVEILRMTDRQEVRRALTEI